MKLMAPSVKCPCQVVTNLPNVSEEGASVNAATRETVLEAAQVRICHASFVPIYSINQNYSS